MNYFVNSVIFVHKEKGLALVVEKKKLKKELSLELEHEIESKRDILMSEVDHFK